MYLCMWGKRNGVHIYNLHTLEFVHKYRIYQIKWWAVTLLMYEQKSHSIDCTLWTVCMHMCVHLWTVDMYKCMQVDLLSKQSFHGFDWEHLYSRQMVEYARVFLCGTLVDSVARLSFSLSPNMQSVRSCLDRKISQTGLSSSLLLLLCLSHKTEHLFFDWEFPVLVLLSSNRTELMVIEIPNEVISNGNTWFNVTGFLSFKEVATAKDDWWVKKKSKTTQSMLPKYPL